MINFPHQMWLTSRGTVTMSPVIPSYIAKRCPVPFVIGPVLGALPWPRGFRKDMLREREWMNYIRPIHRYLPYYRSTYDNAAAVLSAYAHTIKDIPKTASNKIIEFSEGGINPSDFAMKPYNNSDTKTVLFVGRMVPFKQPELLVQCFARSKYLQKHRLVMVGDGPELPRLKSLIEEKNLGGVIELKGTLPLPEVIELMHLASVFAFPSIREQGGGVLTQASMAGTPSIVVDYGGPSARVPEGCGIRIPLGDFEQIEQGFRQALEELLSSPNRIESMGRAAREFTESFYSWNFKAQKTMEIYQWVLGVTEKKPGYWENSALGEDRKPGSA